MCRLVLVSSIHVRQLGEARPPVIQSAVILIPAGAGGVQGAERGGVRPAAFIVKHQERVIWGGGGVVVSRVQILGRQKEIIRTISRGMNNVFYTLWGGDLQSGEAVHGSQSAFSPRSHWGRVQRNSYDFRDICAASCRNDFW